MPITTHADNDLNIQLELMRRGNVAPVSSAEASNNELSSEDRRTKRKSRSPPGIRFRSRTSWI